MKAMLLILSIFFASTLSACKPLIKQMAALSGPVRISAPEADGAEPAVANAPDGNVYVAWINHSAKSQADVIFARLGGDGAMQGSGVRVNPKAGTATAWRGDPPTIAVAPDQTIFIGWTARVESGSGHATDIYVSASHDQGRTFTDPVKVNDDKNPADHGMHSLAIGQDGRIYVAWLDERNVPPMPAMDMSKNQGAGGHHMESNREVFVSYSTDGGRTFSTNKRVAANVCPCCKTSLAIAPDGRVYLGWRQVLPGEFRHIAVASSTDQGQTFSEPKIVGDDQWMIAGCPVSGSSMTVLTDGTLRVLWYSAGKNGETGIYSSDSKDGGKTFAARNLVSKGETRGTPVLLSATSGTIAVWEGDENILTAALRQTPSEAYRISKGELPAAVQTSASLVAAYVGKVDEHRAIYVITVNRPN